MERKSDRTDETHTLIAAQQSPTRMRLLAFLEEQSILLLGITRSYVQQMGLATDAEAMDVALEVMQEAAVEALSHLLRFQPEKQLFAWFLGITLNVIRRKKAERAKRQRRELPLTNCVDAPLQTPVRGDLLDRFIPPLERGPEQELEEKERAEALLSLVSAEDQRILRLSILEDFEREALAAQLGLSINAATVRLHRALRRLRSAWLKHHQQEEGERHV